MAISAFDKALRKGGLDDNGRAYLRKGIAMVNLGSCNSALKVLDQATKYKKHRSAAVGWASYAKERIKANNVKYYFVLKKLVSASFLFFKISFECHGYL